MKLREWHRQQVVDKKMCVECLEVTTLSRMQCKICTCGVFYLLSGLITPGHIDKIIDATENDLTEEQEKDVDKLLGEHYDNNIDRWVCLSCNNVSPDRDRNRLVHATDCAYAIKEFIGDG